MSSIDTFIADRTEAVPAEAATPLAAMFRDYCNFAQRTYPAVSLPTIEAFERTLLRRGIEVSEAGNVHGLTLKPAGKLVVACAAQPEIITLPVPTSWKEAVMNELKTTNRETTCCLVCGKDIADCPYGGKHPRSFADMGYLSIYQEIGNRAKHKIEPTADDANELRAFSRATLSAALSQMEMSGMDNLSAVHHLWYGVLSSVFCDVAIFG